MPIQVTIHKGELYDKKAKRVIRIDKNVTLTLEHSLISISKWEEKWHYAYFSKTHNKTEEELRDYLRCMIIGKPIPAEWFAAISREDANNLSNYIKDSHSALRITDNNEKTANKLVTSEHIYYAMVVYQIPIEFETWHINRLLNFIHLCQIRSDTKNKKKNTLSEDAHMDRARINAERRKALNSKG